MSDPVSSKLACGQRRCRPWQAGVGGSRSVNDVTLTSPLTRKYPPETHPDGAKTYQKLRTVVSVATALASIRDRDTAPPPPRTRL